MYYIHCFFFFSIVGFLLETGTAWISGTGFSSGILFGPWTPVYGLGCVIIILVSRKLFLNLHMHRFFETIIVFLVVTILLTILEWFGGILIETLFGITFWDYRNLNWNIGKYISLEMSMLWGIASILFIYLIHPLTDGLFKKMPGIITVLLILLFTLDIVITFCVRLNIMF